MRGFKKDGKFHPTDKTISGVKKTILEKNPQITTIDNRDLMKEKAVPEISKAKINSLSDNDLKKSVNQLNGIFSGQTNYLQKNNQEFDERVTKESHEKTLDALNMLIEEKEQRQLLKETKKKRKDETIDDEDDYDEKTIEPRYQLDDIVGISTEGEMNENYKDFIGKDLIITNVAVNRDEHQGFDEGVGEALYDFETKDGKEVPFSLYEYELSLVRRSN